MSRDSVPKLDPTTPGAALLAFGFIQSTDQLFVLRALRRRPCPKPAAPQGVLQEWRLVGRRSHAPARAIDAEFELVFVDERFEHAAMGAFGIQTDEFRAMREGATGAKAEIRAASRGEVGVNVGVVDIVVEVGLQRSEIGGGRKYVVRILKYGRVWVGAAAARTTTIGDVTDVAGGEVASVSSVFEVC